MKPFTLISLIFPVFVFASSCRAPADSTGSALRAVSNDAIWIAMDEQQDVYLLAAGSPKDMGICIIEEGQSEAEGVCYTSEKIEGYFRIEKPKLSNKNKKIKIKAYYGDDGADERYRSVALIYQGDDSEPQDDTKPEVKPDPKVDPNSESDVSTLAESFNINLVSSAGKEVPVSEVFTKKYLLVELSAYDCGPCRGFATDFNRQESKYKSYFAEGQCSKLILVADYGGLRGKLNDWMNMLGGNTSFLGKSSYTTKENNLKKVATDLGFKESFGIPTLFLIDRDGNIVDSASGQIPPKAAEVCPLN